MTFEKMFTAVIGVLVTISLGLLVFIGRETKMEITETKAEMVSLRKVVGELNLQLALLQSAVAHLPPEGLQIRILALEKEAMRLQLQIDLWECVQRGGSPDSCRAAVGH